MDREFYLKLCLISSFLLYESGNHNDIEEFIAVRRNQKRSQLAIFRLEELGSENSKTNPSLVLYQSRLSFPVDLLTANLEECVAVEERKCAVDVVQLKRLARV